ncbi:hypothetical protein [Paenibacillus sp. BC26]|uniref:hypothetical protein n=1 Tax=Paenibacillus sp. BC26 TaxID=1881032 RepID=UPI0011601548|nr:hypothetical protein [Paenibacillus sp. BC26]
MPIGRTANGNTGRQCQDCACFGEYERPNVKPASSKVRAITYPQGLATRAEASAIFTMFIQAILK